jgi:hypothetical protein
MIMVMTVLDDVEMIILKKSVKTVLSTYLAFLPTIILLSQPLTTTAVTMMVGIYMYHVLLPTIDHGCSNNDICSRYLSGIASQCFQNGFSLTHFVLYIR